ncbi:hypothetical protein EV421DRAFT_1735845 [Armillaria borealis]|uniref:Uncharacterized protein n=1 Tax=Armillaria borealis TaxID=47425 RepID=A0AA39MR67_9AGAR|nr:hypothetical protein EV421DRAFT_1735845 [Armillaria borealis]
MCRSLPHVPVYTDSPTPTKLIFNGSSLQVYFYNKREYRSFLYEASRLMFTEGYPSISVPRNFVPNHLQPGFQKKPTTLKPYTPCGCHKHGYFGLKTLPYSLSFSRRVRFAPLSSSAEILIDARMQIYPNVEFSMAPIAIQIPHKRVKDILLQILLVPSDIIEELFTLFSNNASSEKDRQFDRDNHPWVQSRTRFIHIPSFLGYTGILELLYSFDFGGSLLLVFLIMVNGDELVIADASEWSPAKSSVYVPDSTTIWIYLTGTCISMAGNLKVRSSTSERLKLDTTPSI